MKSALFFFFASAFFTLIGQDILKIKKIEAMDFDGIVDETEWSAVPTLSLLQHQPVLGKEPTEKTDVYLAYDDQYLYLAGRMYYENPSNMQNTTKERDAFEGSTEYFGLVIDTFNDNENAMGFFTTPAGLRWDGTVFNDAEGDFPVNISWNTFWDVKVNHTDYGWQAEIRIPFTSLRFQNIDGLTTMGLAMWRYMPHRFETVMYPLIRNDLGPWSSWKPSRFQKIQFQNIEPKKPVYIAPYLLAGNFQSNALNDDETNYIFSNETKYEAGLDLKYSLTSNLTMDLTINPDFAQVEVDDQQVNLTRFSLFFPEKRLFFQERSSVFDYGLGGPTTLFYSRRIGLEEDGPVRIFGGARLVGRVGKWDLGFLDMQTDRQNEINSTNYGVFRVRKQIVNDFTYIGGIVTNKIDTDGNYNTGVGLDGVARLSTNDYLTFALVQTNYNGVTPGMFDPTNSKFYVSLRSRKNQGFGYTVSWNRNGPDYNPEMGFEIRDNTMISFNRLWWTWFPKESSPILSHTWFFTGAGFWKNNTGQPETTSLTSGWRFQSKKGSFGELSLQKSHERVFEEFELSSDVLVPVDGYDFWFFNGVFGTPDAKKISISNSLTLGEYYDGNQLVLGFQPGWRVSPSLILRTEYYYNLVNFDSRNASFEAHLARVRALVMLSTKFTASMYGQYNGSENLTSANIRIRYNPREGNDLYVVYNFGTHSNRFSETPALPRTAGQSVILKYTHTFVTR